MIKVFLRRLYNKGIEKYRDIKFRFLLVYKGDKFFLSLPISEEWQQRITDVINCPDNAFIARHELAGRIEKGIQWMHNGIKIQLGSYYGYEIARMLYQNRGVHEPQEEYIFGHILKTLPKNAKILELGAYWGFYSMWFLTSLPQGKAYLIEPDKANLQSGQANFKLNGLSGHFTQAFVSDKSVVSKKTPTVCVDDFLTINGLNFIHILHADIQFFEFKMLQGALQSVKKQKIGYIFISTHSNDLHAQCISWLETHDFIILSEVDLENTYSFDGLIVAKSKYYEGIQPISISRKSHHC